MSRDLNRESARIYQFPTGGRAALGGRHYGEAHSSGNDLSTRVNEAACSDSWYHEAAIREEQAAREH